MMLVKVILMVCSTVFLTLNKLLYPESHNICCFFDNITLPCFSSCTVGFDILVIGLPDHTRRGIDEMMNNITSDEWAGMGLKPPTYPRDVFPTHQASSDRVVESTGWKTGACRINHALTVDISSSREFSDVFLGATSHMYQNNDQSAI